MTNKRKSYLRNTIAALVLVLGLMMPTSTLQAQSGGNQGNPGVFPPNSRPYGKSYGEWGARFFQWLLSIPVSSNPVFTPTASCSAGQSGPVWFLPPNFGGVNTAHCAIPAGKSVAFVLTGYLNDYPCPDPNFQPAPGQSLKDFLTEGARYFIDHTTELAVEVDGVSLQNLFSYRATSNLFNITFDPSLLFLDPCATGSPQPAVTDGYLIMLAPLPVGNHTIHVTAKVVFTQAQDGFDLTLTFENNFHLTVAPHN